jgi:anthranilate synthase component 1
VQWQCNADSLDVFELLTAREPSPYSFHLDLEHGALFGASPETCVRVDDRQVEIRPIAGTTERSSDSDTDARLALALLFDHKERAEHVMLLDLARNDIARIAVPGTTEVVQQFAVEKYSRVQHLVSRVRGTLRPELDALHAYRAAANMGTLSGAPKARATELIREIEPTGRGFYGGAVGYLMADGSFDSCITIRSMRAKNGVYRAQAGAGIVWHSDADRELEETDRKLRAVGEVMASLQGVPSVEVRA